MTRRWAFTNSFRESDPQKSIINKHTVFSKLKNNNWPIVDMVVRRVEAAHRNVQRGRSWNAGLMLITKSGSMYKGQLGSQYGLDSSFSGISALSNSNSASAGGRRFASQNSSQNRRTSSKRVPHLQPGNHSSEQGPEARGNRLGQFKPSNIFGKSYVSNTNLNSAERRILLEKDAEGFKISSNRAILPSNVNASTPPIQDPAYSRENS